MPILHDSTVRTTLRSRIAALSPNATRRWGKMTIDQMLWHCNQALADAIDGNLSKPNPSPIPRPLLRFLVVNTPWPKGAPTNPAFMAGDRHDFSAEKARCLDLIDRFAQKQIDGEWPESHTFGPVSGRFMSRLQAKHLDHHLKQFGG
jgi:hypothetical protein